jgi:hypothetical protein
MGVPLTENRVKRATSLQQVNEGAVARSSQGQRSPSVSGIPADIFATFAAG